MMSRAPVRGREVTAGPAGVAELSARRTAALLGLASAGLAAGLLASLSLSPAAGAALACAVVVVPVALARPRVALFLLVAVEVTNSSAVVGERGGVSLYLVALALAVVSATLGVARGALRPEWSPLPVLGLVFLAVRALSLVAAQDPSIGLPVVTETAKDLVFLTTVTLLVTGTRDPVTPARLAVALVAALAGLTLVQEYLLGNATAFAGYGNVTLDTALGGVTARHSGPVEDPNYWARTLALCAPLALGLSARRGVPLRRAGWLAAGATLCAGVAVTQSRGGLLAVGLACLAWFALACGGYRRALLVGPLVVALALLSVPNLGARLADLADFAAGDPGGDVSLADRLTVQRLGADMFLANPVLGVGPGNFLLALPESERRLGVTPTERIGPHNLYLEMAAEGGLPGLTAWLLFYGGALFLALRALLLLRPPEGISASGPARLAAGVVAGLLGWGLASLFLGLAHLRVLMVVMAVAAGLDAAARRASAPALVTPAAPGPTPAVRVRRAAAGACLAAAASAVALLTVPALTPVDRAWQATSSARVVPQGRWAPYTRAYQLDLLNRGTVPATYAEIVRRRSPEETGGGHAEVDVGAAAVVTVMARADDPDTATRVAADVLRRGRGYVEDLDGLYTLRTRGSPVSGGRRDVSLRPAPLALALLLTGAAAAVGARRPRRARG